MKPVLDSLLDIQLAVETRDIGLSVRDGQIVIRAPKGSMDAELFAAIKVHKSALIELLGAERGAPVREEIPRQAQTSEDGTTVLSSGQERLWVLEQLSVGPRPYNTQIGLRLRGELDRGALDRALAELVETHELLRASFPQVDGRPRQALASPGAITWQEVDLRELPEAARELELRRIWRERGCTPYALERGPLVRATIVVLGHHEHLVAIAQHHIITDGTAIIVLLYRLMARYRAHCAGVVPALEPPALRYSDYAQWQREQLGSSSLAAAADWWREQLAGLEPLDLPMARPLTGTGDRQRSSAGATHPIRWSRELVDSARGLAAAEGSTLFVVLLSAYAALLHRYGGQEDFALGTVGAGRERPQLSELLGFFVRTLALRCDFSRRPNFRELIARMTAVVAEAFEHQELPFDEVVRAAGATREGANPLIRTHFVLENMKIPALELPGLSYEPMLDTPSGALEGSSKFDLGLIVAEDAEGVGGVLEYSTDLFDAATIERFVAHLHELLEGALRRPDAALAELPLMGAEERERLLCQWNATHEPGLEEGLLHELIEASVDREPARVAVVGERGGQPCELSYAELDGLANGLAHVLRERGVGPDVCVAVCLERSIEVIVALLGVLKAGGAYVILDPEAPGERLRDLLDDLDAPLALTQAELVDKLGEATPLLVLDPEWSCLADAPRGRVAVPGLEPGHLAYVLYTSGSTGRPKGVMLEHRQIVNYVRGVSERLELPHASHYAHVSTFAADLGNTVLFPALVLGGTLHVLSSERLLEHQALGDYFERNAIDCLKIVPSHLAALMLGEAPARVLPRERLILGGEAASPELIEQIEALAPGCRIFNHYGPTETTVGVLTHALARGVPARERGRIPLGRALPNTQIYLVDGNLAPVPVGVPGELLIGGASVARGYLKREALSAERFIENPFAAEPGACARVYRSGDRARYRADGALEFLGRVDHQVKIRGFRIELGEIEAVLAGHPSVREVLLGVHEQAAAAALDRRLVAYIVPSPSATQVGSAQLRASELRTYLGASLPDYMIPSAFVELGAMPLTPNGKIDRRALPEPDWSTKLATAARSYTPLQELLAGIWAEVMSIEPPPVDASFFELGGHSLMAAQIMARVRGALELELPLRALMQAPTIAGLAARIEADDGRRQGAARIMPPLQPRAPGVELPLSFSQQRVCFLAELDPDSVFYSIPMAVELSGQLDRGALAAALREIVRRHESLRTRFPRVDLEPVQLVVEPALDEWLPMPILDLSALAPAARMEGVQASIAEEGRRGFDLESGPPIRARLLALDKQTHVLVVTIHHIVYDGWSLGVLVHELSKLYGAFSQGRASPLAPLELQYGDVALWQRQWLRGEVLTEQLGYWRQQLAGIPAALELPTDRPRPPIEGHEGAALPVALPRTLSEAIVTLSRREGATVFMTLLAGFSILLQRYSGQDDIVVGSPVANRSHAQSERLVGLFLNNLVLRTDLSGRPSFRELLARVRDTALDAYAHQHLPFEKLVSELAPVRDTSRAPLFQAMLVLQNTPLGEVDLPGLTLRVLETVSTTSKYDLALALRETEDGLVGNLEYNTDLFEEQTAARMVAQLETLLAAAVADPDQAIDALPLMDGAERHRVLVEWNQDQASRPTQASPEGLLHHLFRAQARRTPDAIALEFGGHTLSYAELEARANSLAHALVARGVGPDARVGIYMERSLELFVAIYAVLAAGGAYLPLDPEYPADRLAFMVEDSGARLVLTTRELAAAKPRALTRAGVEAICVDEPADLATESSAAPTVETTAEDLAYVIYTSGSTGTPKGVMVTHRGVHNYLSWRLEAFGLGPEDRVLHKTSISFDSSVWELFEALAVGARVIVAAPGVQRDPRKLIAQIAAAEITAIDFVPSLLRAVLDEPELAAGCASLRRISTGGEALSKELLTRFCALSEARVYNGYGPTETTVASTFWACDPDYPRGVPIGRPVANTRLYVLDAGGQPVPIGVPGELYIGGAGVARGYLGRPELTAERFVPDPFVGDERARMYRTGDRVRYLADGNLAFLGRVDRQVKIRGFRVELGEVERALGLVPGVAEAVVLAVPDTRGQLGLVAYYVPSSSPSPSPSRALEVARAELSPPGLRAALGSSLPDYMVPTTWVELDALPLTPSGKLDRGALPEPVAAGAVGARSGYLAPRTELERELVTLWAELLELERERVGIEDSFFDLGGHSLLLPRLHRQVQAMLGVELELVDLFRHSTIRALSELVEPQVDAVAPARRACRRSRVSAGSEDEPIAIIGMSGRFPGAEDVGELWRELAAGIEGICRFDDAQLRAAGVSEATLADPRYVRARGILEGPELFDAAFFGVSPREAQLLDPQQRILLEEAWHLFEDAGHDPGAYEGRVGVFAGASYSPYLFTHLAQDRELLDIVGPYQMVVANSRDFVATRLAHKLDLRGPALTVQTACSTSLVAVHLACQSLRAGEADMALAGGANVCPPFTAGYLHHEGGIHSADGHCRPFDAQASGTVSGQGVGLVLLKRLSDAIADGDSVRALILGSAVNNDGAGKIGFTAPSIDGQVEVICDALAAAKVEARSVGYVEAHGTGTALGDPIEVRALSEAYDAHEGEAETDRGERAPPLPRGLGSIKSNIGHLDAAAGVTGLIKATLCVERGQIPATLHFERPNPALGLEGSTFEINAELRGWPAIPGHDGVEGPRRAAVSALGLGGTNAHVVLEQGELTPSGPGRARELLLLSARSRPALDALTAKLARSLAAPDGPALADVAHTLQIGRRRFEHRRAIVCRSREDAAAALEPRDPRRVYDRVAGDRGAQPPSVALLFAGHGSVYAGAARGLAALEPVFGAALERCAERLEPLLGCDLRELLESPDASAAGRPSLALEAGAGFSFQYALARLWMSWGLRPSALLGHSMGEYVAACLAGVFELDDALKLVMLRGRLFDRSPVGAMLAVALPEAELATLLGDEIDFASVNGPRACVVSGPPAAISSLAATLAARGVGSRAVAVDRALHSRLLEPVLPEFRAALEDISLGAPALPFISSLTGTWIGAEQAQDPDYWVRQLRAPVRFAAGLAALFEDEGRLVLDLGPRQMLTRMVRRSGQGSANSIFASTPRSSAGSSAAPLEQLLTSLGGLWAAGVELDWAGFRAGEQRRRVSVPGYCFERQRHWVEAPGAPAREDESRARESSAAAGATSPVQELEPPREDGGSREVHAPRSALERELAGIWSAALGVDEIGAFDDFFALGGDSLIAVQVTTHASAALGARLSPSALIEAPILADYAAAISTRLQGEGDEGDEGVSSATEGASSTAASAWSPAVLLQAGGGRGPSLFLSHAAGGGVYFYRLLARALGPRARVFGLEARGLHDPSLAHTSLEDMASCQLEAIQAIQPRGPYYLGGTSMGGTLAYRMAQRLRESGEEVAYLALMDTPGPGQMPTISPDQAHRLIDVFGDWIPLKLDELRALDEHAQLELVIARAQALRGRSEAVDAVMSFANTSPTQLRELLRLFEINVRAFVAHEPTPYAGRVGFFRASERRASDPRCPERPWIELARGGIEIDLVPGNHTTILHPPHVSELAGRLRARLRAAGMDL